MTCAPTKRHPHAKTRNLTPVWDSARWLEAVKPELRVNARTFPPGQQAAEQVFDSLRADDEAHQVRGHHHEDVEDRPNGAHMPIPRPLAELRALSIANRHERTRYSLYEEAEGIARAVRVQ